MSHHVTEPSRSPGVLTLCEAMSLTLTPHLWLPPPTPGRDGGHSWAPWLTCRISDLLAWVALTLCGVSKQQPPRGGGGLPKQKGVRDLSPESQGPLVFSSQ